MTLKELIRDHRTDNIELIVWNDKRNHGGSAGANPCYCH